MRKSLTLVLLGLSHSFVGAACWKVADLRGNSARAAESYSISADGFTGQTFEISITSKSGSVKPSDLKCQPASTNSLLCIEAAEGRLTVETWSIDASAKKVVHTKAVSGYGPFDGANLFVGKVVGTCSDG